MRDQHNEPLNDALAHDIEQALAVEPSPEFQARVRQRVAQELPPTDAGLGWWRPTLWPAAVAVATAAVLIVSMLWSGREPRDQQPRHQQAAQIDSPVRQSLPPASVAGGSGASQPVAPPAGAAEDRPTRGHVPGEPPVQVVETARAHGDPFSDVLVSASEVEAVRQVTALLSPEDVLKPPPTVPAPEGINELVIAPISVAPIQLRPIEGEAE